MKRVVIIIAVIALFATAAFVLAGAAKNEVAPNAGHGSGPAIDALGDLVFTTDVGTPTGCTGLLGVEYVAPYFYLTGANTTGNMVYVVDAAGTLVDSFSQGTSTEWGWRDLAYDGAYLYASDGANIQYFTLDGTIVGSIPGPEDPNRALAYDPDTDHFWVANYTSDISEITRTGTVVNSYSNAYSVYGMAWDNISEGGPFLWMFEQDNNIIRQFSPATGAYTGVTITDIPGTSSGYAGGLCFVDEWEEADASAILVGLMQYEPDVIFGSMVIDELWPSVKAYYTNDAPTIDGEITSEEWDGAYVLEYEGANMDFTVYLKDDGDYLYVAVDAVDDTTLDNGDILRIYFDNDNDDALPTTCVPGTNTDGYYHVAYISSTVNLVYMTAYDNGGTPTTCTTDTPAAMTGTMALHGNVQYEFQVDLDGGEMYGDLGETIGVLFDLTDGATDYAEEIWPPEGVKMDLATYGDLKYLACTGCFIDDYCYESGEQNPSNECEVCNPSTPSAWSNNTGFVCGDDGVFCNGDEVCESGSCSGHSGDPCTTDYVFCNGDEVCNEETDVCDHSGDPCTDDGLWCNGEESCGELMSTCWHSGSPCAENEECVEDTDECVPATDDDDDDDDDDDTIDDDDDDDDGCGC